MALDRRFAFTKLLVGDLEGEVAFYSAVLGLIIKHRLSAGEGEEVILCATGREEPSLVLLHRPHQARPQPGEAVLGFVVDDVEQVVRAADGAGGVVRVAPKAVPRAGVTVAQVEDPDGHLLELLQYQ
ncbi:VOC family protein [Nonomuraea angiospora]|uniref:VOC family protein n=1 Tax=Nonomuraea TaxID=83681 RepID=UPI0029BB3E82|nr:VOC family protein [Nonomuraea angiospora]MDX3100971.1 VOC family protein [Nonomuraea angiospora]